MYRCYCELWGWMGSPKVVGKKGAIRKEKRVENHTLGLPTLQGHAAEEIPAEPRELKPMR